MKMKINNLCNRGSVDGIHSQHNQNPVKRQTFSVVSSQFCRFYISRYVFFCLFLFWLSVALARSHSPKHLTDRHTHKTFSISNSGSRSTMHSGITNSAAHIHNLYFAWMVASTLVSVSLLLRFFFSPFYFVSDLIVICSDCKSLFVTLTWVGTIPTSAH